jgi:hypothetical protein
LDALTQFFKTAYFQLSKKHHKLKEYSAFINAKNLLNDNIKCNSYFYNYYDILIF